MSCTDSNCVHMDINFIIVLLLFGGGGEFTMYTNSYNTICYEVTGESKKNSIIQVHSFYMLPLPPNSSGLTP